MSMLKFEDNKNHKIIISCLKAVKQAVTTSTHRYDFEQDNKVSFQDIDVLLMVDVADTDLGFLV